MAGDLQTNSKDLLVTPDLNPTTNEDDEELIKTNNLDSLPDIDDYRDDL